MRYWGKGKYWMNKNPETTISYCRHYSTHPQHQCHIREAGISGSCFFARKYTHEGIVCSLLDRTIPSPFIPECTKYDFTKKLLEII